MSATIYALLDPITRETRYIGKTTQRLWKRIAHHLCPSPSDKSYRARWIRLLRSEGKKPIIQVLEDNIEGCGSEQEVAWIVFFRKAGARLTNLTDGGEGRPGFVMPPEQKSKIGWANSGRVLTEQHRRLIGEQSKARGISPATRAKMAASLRGKPKSKEHTAKVVATKLRKSQERRKVIL